MSDEGSAPPPVRVVMAGHAATYVPDPATAGPTIGVPAAYPADAAS